MDNSLIAWSRCSQSVSGAAERLRDKFGSTLGDPLIKALGLIPILRCRERGKHGELDTILARDQHVWITDFPTSFSAMAFARFKPALIPVQKGDSKVAAPLSKTALPAF